MRNLSCHAAPGDLPIERLEAAVTVTPAALGGDARLKVHFRLVADLRQLRLPSPRQGQRQDVLWRHTCFEVFARARDDVGYVEVNLAPSGDWAAYRFSAYRAGLQPIAPMSTPALELATTATTLDLRTSLSLGELRVGTPQRAATTLDVALAAVIEERSGGLSYWALTHPDPRRPDFHHPESFAHEIRY